MSASLLLTAILYVFVSKDFFKSGVLLELLYHSYQTLFTVGVVAACVGGIYGVCILLYGVLIPLFPVGGAIVGGAIAIVLLLGFV